MDQDRANGQKHKSEKLNRRRAQAEFSAGITHHSDRRGGIEKATQVNLAKGNEKARIGRQEQHEIEPSGSDVFRELHDVAQEKCGVKLLNEMAGADQHDDLPL